MTIPNWSPLARHRPFHELSREDAGGIPGDKPRMREGGLKDANTLSATEAVAAVRAIREKALRRRMPDSTPMIRADRDGR